MSDKAIILSVILAAVLCVAVPFIFRVCRYRRRMKTLIVPDGPSGEVAVGTVPTPEAEYVDKVLKAHLDDNRETIERLFEEREAVASRQPKAEER